MLKYYIMRFILPFPPSVNAPYKMERGRRTKGNKVIAWEKLAGEAINKQNIMPFVGRCIIEYELFHPDNRIRDAANYEKIVTDFLVSKNILNGDDRRYIKGINIFWNDKPGENILINIIPST